MNVADLDVRHRVMPRPGVKLHREFAATLLKESSVVKCTSCGGTFAFEWFHEVKRVKFFYPWAVALGHRSWGMGNHHAEETLLTWRCDLAVMPRPGVKLHREFAVTLLKESSVVKCTSCGGTSAFDRFLEVKRVNFFYPWSAALWHRSWGRGFTMLRKRC